MSILVSMVRVSGFRGIENFEIELGKTTVLTGMNNAGKTSLLKSLQLALAGRQSLTNDDLYIKGNSAAEKIVIDTLIVPVDEAGARVNDFGEDWEILFTTDRIRTDGEQDFIPLRTVARFDPVKNSFDYEQFIMQVWPPFFEGGVYWHETPDGSKSRFSFDEIPFFLVDAQRDILEDTKLRNSYLGKMLSRVEYSDDDVFEIEEQIRSLNERAVEGSDILRGIKLALSELDTAMSSSSDGVEITPFTKKIRDLSKGLTIYYADGEDSFSMEYHGMGTRSWSSLLTLKAFINLLSKSSVREGMVFFPIVAVEEPEAHLHPNAQKKIYKQIADIEGQKIISTHSPYIAASSCLAEVRSFYKDDVLRCGRINTEELTSEEARKISRQVVSSRGEMFFSKLIVFVEGETEEQALPIFFDFHFGVSHVEMGVDFVSVNSYTAYLPFLRFSEGLNIPWLIYSDAEESAKKSVSKQLKKIGKSEDEVGNFVVFVDDGNDFERQLIQDGYTEEIKQAIASFDVYQTEQHRNAREEQRLAEIAAYTNDELYGIITSDKTKYGPVLAELIVRGGKALPPKIIDLFSKVRSVLGSQDNA
ncbi:ATP-dependent nuclease [Billgrantia lactosivorans]|uniref:ATP-dependent nuclease n=1 Tax=Billgrantia lactosivorans TaxID=2185141 RepID=UPI000DABEF52|nr:AAA family ATPase [Halomonas lactosivorans]